jgi:class 3 adenylate cyclase
LPAPFKNFDEPDEVIALPGIREHIVEMGGMTVGRTTQEPGWRWSTHVKPVVGGEWCEAHHIGVVVSGRCGIELRDGSTAEFGPDDVYDIPPGHDGYTLGDEPCVLVEWSGLRAIARGRVGFHGRTLATLLFTDLVDSTATAARLGDAVWRDVLERHRQAVRARLERYHGREIDTAGDGFLVVFDAPAPALRCAVELRGASADDGLEVRIGIHVGEVDMVGTQVRGLAVHQAARVMASAGPGEVLVTDPVRMLASPDLEFTDRGEHELKGIDGPVALHAFAGSKEPPPGR